MDHFLYLYVFVGLTIILFTSLRMIHGFIVLVRTGFGANPAYRKLNPIYKPYLQKYFSFYNKLSLKNKELFEKRVQLFIYLKIFIPRGGIKRITPEMKAIIAGSAIQITFGYPKVYFKYFRRILIFPDKYYNKRTKQYHKGEVSTKGIIVLSVNNLILGYENDNDGINLGLHEIAHALNIENMVTNSEFKFLDTETLKILKEEAKIEAYKIKTGQNNLYRKYGAINFQEFFAVSVELFFEKPLELRDYNPYIYSLLVKILNLNPLTFT